jgi:hypothetical protein
MTSKNKNNFVSYLEDGDSLLQGEEREKRRHQTLSDSTLKKMNEYNHSLIVIYLMVGILLIGVIFFWWNISRDKFYAAMDEPIEHSAVQSVFYKLDALTEESDQALGEMQAEQELEMEALMADFEEDETVLEKLKEKINDDELSEVLELDN